MSLERIAIALERIADLVEAQSGEESEAREREMDELRQRLGSMEDQRDAAWKRLREARLCRCGHDIELHRLCPVGTCDGCDCRAWVPK